MIKNYFKIAWRSLWKDKSFSFLNIVGLSVAFTAAILLGIAGVYELSYDNFHKNSDQTYVVYANNQRLEGTKSTITQPIPMAPTLQEEVPGIKNVSRILESFVRVSHESKEFNIHSLFVDPEFFEMLSFPVQNGNNQNPLEQQNSVALTPETATTIFGSTNVVGKTLNIRLDRKMQSFVVSALLEEVPANSSFQFGLALNIQNMKGYANLKDRWDARNHKVVLQLENGVSAASFEEKAKSFTQLHFESDINDSKRMGAQPNAEGLYKELKLMPIENWHYVSVQNGEFVVSHTYAYLILGLAFLIIFIASINFINMSIARSTKRLKEIGMRKTLGAGKSQLFFQFWAESIFIFVISIIVGAGLSSLLLDSFSSLFKVSSNIGAILSPLVVCYFIGVLLLITFIAGGYPALLLTRLKTIQSLKGQMDMTSKNRLRDILMVFQFSVAILLISGTLVLSQQLDFMRNKNLGFNKEQVIAFPLNGKNSGRTYLNSLRNELRGNPNIEAITGADNILGRDVTGTSSEVQMGFDYKDSHVKTNILVVGYDYVETLGLELKEGRSFSREYGTDSLTVLINEKMLEQIGEENPLEVKFDLDGKEYAVIGVLKDYNFQELNREIQPITIFVEPKREISYAYVKVAKGTAAKSFDQVEEAWKNVEPNSAFLAAYLDENIDRTFRDEKRLNTIITSGSILAIVLSCIGLFAMSMLVVSQRRKEIGIRKVIGASVGKITVLLTSDFLKLVGIAFLIAAPISWYFSNQWLQNYAFRIDLSLWIIISAGIIAFFIAIVTISFKTINAAIVNPIKSLKTE